MCAETLWSNLKIIVTACYEGLDAKTIINVCVGGLVTYFFMCRMENKKLETNCINVLVKVRQFLFFKREELKGLKTLLERMVVAPGEAREEKVSYISMERMRDYFIDLPYLLFDLKKLTQTFKLKKVINMDIFLMSEIVANSEILDFNKKILIVYDNNNQLHYLRQDKISQGKSKNPIKSSKLSKVLDRMLRKNKFSTKIRFNLILKFLIIKKVLKIEAIHNLTELMRLLRACNKKYTDILSLVENSNEDRKILLSLPVGADQNEKSKLVTLILLREKMAKQTLEVIKECLKIIRIADTEAAKYLCTLHVPTHILPEDENVEVNMSK